MLPLKHDPIAYAAGWLALARTSVLLRALCHFLRPPGALKLPVAYMLSHRLNRHWLLVHLHGLRNFIVLGTLWSIITPTVVSHNSHKSHHKYK
jgi:hypothetical protein